jgi:anti-anti-sigma regulatory factor
VSVTMHSFPGRGVVTVQISGRFDMSQWAEFNALLADARESHARYIIDLHGADQVLDSGLAMLLLLGERVGLARLEILNCHPELRRRLLGALGPVELGAMNAASSALRVMPLVRSQGDLVDPDLPGRLRGWGD